MKKRAMRGKTLNYYINVCCCMGTLLLGYDQGVMSGLIGADNKFGRDFNRPDAKLQGTIVSIYDIGCAIGSLVSFFFAEKFGRKKMIGAGGLIMLIGTAILTSSTTLAQLLVGRILTGVGNGFNSSNVPMYQSETAPSHSRGTVVCLQSTLAIIGLVIAYWLDYGTSFIEGPAQWRLPIGFQAVFALFLLVQAFGLPETPRWLVEQGRIEEAAQVIEDLTYVATEETFTDAAPHARNEKSASGKDHGFGFETVNEYSEAVLSKLREIQESVERESAGGPFKYRELFTGGKMGNGRRIALSIAINVMQQFTGANIINYNAPTVYQNAMNLSRNLSLILGGCTAVTYMFASFIPLWTIERFGRRNLLMISAAGLSACFALAAIFLSQAEKYTGNKAASLGAAATAMVFLFQVFLGIGWLPIPWLYPTEVSTTRIRARATSISSFFNWMSVFIVVQITPIAIDNISWRVFIIFAIFNALWVPIVYAFFPETSGLALEDLDHLFDKGGFTGGVFTSKGGRTIVPRKNAMVAGDVLQNIDEVVSGVPSIHERPRSIRVDDSDTKLTDET